MHGGTYEVPDNNTVHELKQSDNNQESEEGINQLDSGRRFLEIVIPYA